MTNQDFNSRLNIIVENAVNKALRNHVKLVTEASDWRETIKKLKSAAKNIRQQDNNTQEDDKKEDNKQEFSKKKDVHKKALKKKGGSRADFNAKEDQIYNNKIDDMEQSELSGLLNNGFFNIAKIAQELYPDHTAEGAQSQLRKKLNGDIADSGKKYQLKTKEVKKLRAIMSKYLGN